MVVFNPVKKEIDIKIVYYGPALCGKTSNLQSVHLSLNPDQRGELVSLATKDDRTLFFDFLPIELDNIKGFKTRFHIYTVPGQVLYTLTRKAVLTGVDGIIFVADSEEGKMEENIESLDDLKENLKTKNIKILMLSAKDEQFERITGLELGADDYETKPFSPSHLANKIKKMCIDESQT